MPSTVLTLALDPDSHALFETLRQRHYPAALNRIPAHLTLFHTLPDTDDIASTLARQADEHTPFPLAVTGLLPLGRGVAFRLEGHTALSLHRSLALAFAPHLSAQDRQPFRPHIVVQNKSTPQEAKALLAHLSATFTPHQVTATGLDWWDYLNGPWQLRQHFPFRALP